MGTFTIRHTFDVDPDTFWDEVFFDQKYNVELYEKGLGFGFEIVEQKTHDDGVITRKVKTEPRVDAPQVVKKLIGDSITYLESGRFDPKKRVWNFDIQTSKLSDKISIQGEFWVEPKGDGKLERMVRTTIEVKIFGVGKAVESYVEKTTRESYDKAAAFTNKWLRENDYVK